MGELTDKDILCGMFGEQKIYTPTQIRNIIRRAPVYKRIEPTTVLERRMAGKYDVAHVCVKCNHAIGEGTLPQEQRFCFYCGQRITGIVDAADVWGK